MTATRDIANVNMPTNQSNDLGRIAWKKSFAVSNLVSKALGFVLMACALGLWFASSSIFDPQILLVKVGLSLMFFIGGIALFHSARRASAPDVEFDQVRREVRVVQRSATSERVLQTVSFDELGQVDMQDGLIRAHDKNGELLVELIVEDQKAFRTLKRQLTPVAQ